MIVALEIYRKDGKRVAVLRRANDGNLICNEATEAMRADVERWIGRGLVEMAGPTAERRTRHTPPDDPTFLARLGMYVQAHGFRPRMVMEEFREAPEQAAFVDEVTYFNPQSTRRVSIADQAFCDAE